MISKTQILYSSTPWISDIPFLCDSGEPTIKLNMFRHNLDRIPITRNFLGRQKELEDLNNVLRRMATRTGDSFDVCTITGICGQGKVSPRE